MGVSSDGIFVFDQFPLHPIPALAFLMAKCKVNNMGMYSHNDFAKLRAIDISQKGQEKKQQH